MPRSITLNNSDDDVLYIYKSDGTFLCQINMFDFESGGGDVDVILPDTMKGHFLAMFHEPTEFIVGEGKAPTRTTLPTYRLDVYNSDVRVWAIDIKPA